MYKVKDSGFKFQVTISSSKFGANGTLKVTLITLKVTLVTLKVTLVTSRREMVTSIYWPMAESAEF